MTNERQRQEWALLTAHEDSQLKRVKEIMEGKVRNQVWGGGGRRDLEMHFKLSEVFQQGNNMIRYALEKD